MKSIYITSVEPYSGKTAFVLGLGKLLKAKGLTLGYLKPMSTQPWRTPEGELADEDANFVNETLELGMETTSLAPVIVTPERLREKLQEKDTEGALLDKISESAQELGEGRDALLVEGGASLREGYAMGLSNLKVAQRLGAPVVVLVKYRGDMELVDDALTAQFRLGDQLLGIIFNHIPEEAVDFVLNTAKPFLQRQDINVLGCLPHVPKLSAMAMPELMDRVKAEVMTENVPLDALIENFTVGAMNAEAALSRFRRQQNKVVITGGDRTDIQLAALETSTAAIILTGNIKPSPLILDQAEKLGVPVLLVETNTMETVEIIEKFMGKTRLGQTEKLETFQKLMEENIRLDEIYEVLGVD
ncbi:MAG: phosphotransacetylase family protein [Anaerolineales bacterium]